MSQSGDEGVKRNNEEKGGEKQLPNTPDISRLKIVKEPLPYFDGIRSLHETHTPLNSRREK